MTAQTVGPTTPKPSTVKAWLSGMKAKWLMWRRKRRILAATRILRKLDCVPVGAPSLQQCMEELAKIATFVEQSGEIRHRTHAYTKLSQMLRVAVISLQGAAQMGDPDLSAEKLSQVFIQHQWMRLSRRRKAQFQKAAAAQGILKDLMPRKGK